MEGTNRQVIQHDNEPEPDATVSDRIEPEPDATVSELIKTESINRTISDDPFGDHNDIVFDTN